MSSIESMNLAALGDRLRIARSTAGLTQGEVANRLKIARTTLVAVEQGQRFVRPEELRALAGAYGVSVNDLLRSSAVHLDLAAKFRRVTGDVTQSKAEEEAVHLLNRLASSMAELEARLNQKVAFHHPPEKKILPGDIEEQAEDMALDLRHRMGIGLSPVTDILNLVEGELGIRVFIRPLKSSISGLFAYEPSIGPCILVNLNHSVERQVLTIVHEMGHFFVTRAFADIFDDAHANSREEKFVTAFALSFLMPAVVVRQRFQEICDSGRPFSPRHLVLMAQMFHVSVEAMCRRLEHLHLLPMGTFDSLKERRFAIEAAKKAVGGQEPTRLVNTPPRLILLAIEAYKQELFTEGQLCHMLAMSRIELRGYLDALGGSELDDPITFQT